MAPGCDFATIDVWELQRLIIILSLCQILLIHCSFLAMVVLPRSLSLAGRPENKMYVAFRRSYYQTQVALPSENGASSMVAFTHDKRLRYSHSDQGLSIGPAANGRCRATSGHVTHTVPHFPSSDVRGTVLGSTHGYLSGAHTTWCLVSGAMKNIHISMEAGHTTK